MATRVRNKKARANPKDRALGIPWALFCQIFEYKSGGHTKACINGGQARIASKSKASDAKERVKDICCVPGAIGNTSILLILATEDEGLKGLRIYPT